MMEHTNGRYGSVLSKYYALGHNNQTVGCLSPAYTRLLPSASSVNDLSGDGIYLSRNALPANSLEQWWCGGSDAETVGQRGYVTLPTLALHLRQLVALNVVC
jgi:hypothetical protein